MVYVNVGAFGKNGHRIKTKKQLRDELTSDAAAVYFDSTSVYNNAHGYQGDTIPAEVTLSVVGPDPFTKRLWYASVTVKADGSIKVA